MVDKLWVRIVKAMKKTLLLAEALACSGAAQADIYFCATSIFTTMDLAFGVIVEEKKGSDKNYTFVVDTDICRDYSYNPPRQKRDSIIGGSIART